MKRIRIDVDQPGSGSFSYELESCPIKAGGICRIANKDCPYGLTEIKPPSFCPIKRGGTLTMKFTITKAREIDHE